MGSNPIVLLRWLLVCAFSFALAVSCSAEPEPPDASSALTAQSPAPVPSPTVKVLNGSVPGSLEIVADGVIDLASDLIVERLNDDGSFVPLQNLDGDSMKLVTSCEYCVRTDERGQWFGQCQQVGKCVRIDERGLRPVPWRGMT
ncbi:MAG: hypothetical protein FWD67_11780, partial [Betaproteobacteria bacterium]|nr:hypothetical protein [Betaproteobacteria bacterium]